MTKLLLVPAVFLAACTDGLPPEEDQVTGSATEDQQEEPTAPGTPGAENELFVSFSHEPNDCSDHTIRLLGRFVYTDGTVPENVRCSFTLLDGTVLSDRCFAIPSIPVGQPVTFTVTDLDTGAVGMFSEFVQGPASFGTTLGVSTSGSTLSWEAHNDYGGVLDVGVIQIRISPSANVVVADPTVLNQFSGSVTVTEPGTYTVTAFGILQFGEVGGCGAEAVQTIHVACDDTMHEH